jgi:hypothetical protein
MHMIRSHKTGCAHAAVYFGTAWIGTGGAAAGRVGGVAAHP